MSCPTLIQNGNCFSFQGTLIPPNGGVGGNLQGATAPPTFIPPTRFGTWNYLVNSGPQKGQIYTWNVPDQAWE